MDGENKENEYALLQFERDEDGTKRFQKVVFYKMNEDGTTENGTTLEEMLRVSIERLTTLNEKFPCQENISAITAMKIALLWLGARTSDRKMRRVEGKHEA